MAAFITCIGGLGEKSKSFWARDISKDNFKGYHFQHVHKLQAMNIYRKAHILYEEEPYRKDKSIIIQSFKNR